MLPKINNLIFFSFSSIKTYLFTLLCYLLVVLSFDNNLLANFVLVGLVKLFFFIIIIIYRKKL